MTDTQTETQRRSEVDLDHHSPEFRDNPHGTFRAMRESGCPVAHSDHYGGFWALVDYASVFEAARRSDSSSSTSSQWPASARSRKPNLLNRSQE